MNSNSRFLIYTLSGVLFVISFVGMLIYGYKAFYIEAEKVESDDYTYHFALIAEEIENDYWRLIEEGAKDAALENNIYLEYMAPQKADNDELLKLLDRMISAKVDGILTQGVEGDRFVDLVHKAIERGIPIITVDTDVKSSERNVYVGTDNFYAGQLAGKTIIENTTGEQYVGIITGRFDAINQQERLEGLKQAFKAEERIHIVDIKESNITEVGATQATYSLLKNYPSITALVGTSALDGIGMVQGINEIASRKDIYITAFDVLPDTLALIRQNKIDATIAQYPKEMGYKSVEVMMELQGEGMLNSEVYTETRILEKQDLKGFQNGGIK
ncbi:sugar-binding protein [Virgibacillus litoralis]|uniref:Ribose transport system substrate-binding protein n=1 Tax=Virgibacillus litoralis TaxID=578221 RepID=A0ABS4HFU0_9BACI|nr:sugar-binding protein [Virgibacillus litoralis]MBP1949786.1 ribose transport system substrate-binding protein [Virgibacillus litoralis]